MNSVEKKEKTIEAVMVFVMNKNKQILLLKRLDNSRWEPIKGGINIGESFDAAIIRELKEEANIILESKPILLGIVDDVLDTSEGKSTKIHGHVVLAIVDGVQNITLGSGEHEEHSEYRWVNMNLVEAEDLYPSIANKMIKIINENQK